MNIPSRTYPLSVKKGNIIHTLEYVHINKKQSIYIIKRMKIFLDYAMINFYAAKKKENYILNMIA